MSKVIHARLDDDTDALREQLRRRHGWNDSQIVREGIKALARKPAMRGKRRIIGQGEFKSGIGDLSSNPKHLDDFGK